MTTICNSRCSHYANQHKLANHTTRQHCIQHLGELADNQVNVLRNESLRLVLIIAAKVSTAVVVLASPQINPSFVKALDVLLEGGEKLSNLYSQQGQQASNHRYKICETHLSECQQDKISDLFTRLDHNQEEHQRKHYDVLRAATGG